MPMLLMVSAAEVAAEKQAAAAGIDRLDVRPDKGIMKVNFDDRLATEVTVTIHSGEVLSTGSREDVFLKSCIPGRFSETNGF